MDEQQQIQAVYTRAHEILALLPGRVPLDQITATALVLTAALMVHEGVREPMALERWLATCTSVFNAAKEVLDSEGGQ